LAALPAAIPVVLPGTAHASGYGDWTGVGAAVLSFGLGILNGLVFLAVVAIGRRYTIWSISRFLSYLLLFGLSEAAVFGLTLMIWDQRHSGEHFMAIAMGLNVLHPAVFLPAMRVFRKDTRARTVWTVNAVAGALGSIVALLVVVLG
jgi:hypothetical protein